ncbi:sulfatase [Labilibacter sediminis]|nr:sulfatase [Labilibacter sediminis]
MKLLSYIILVAVIAVGCTSPKQTQSESNSLELKKVANAKKRNVIFILTDDHRYDYMGFTGKVPWLETPNMDKMAQEGAYMENAFVTTSLCSPSRASILTGQYSHVHTIVDNVAPNPGNLTFFPQYLQKAGYQTSFFGKWHMGDHNDDPRPGFDHWESFKGQGEYYSPNLNINGERVQYDEDTYITDLLTEHAIEWLDNRDKEKPFFVYLSHKAVHAMFKPAKRHDGVYDGKTIELPSTYTQTKDDTYKDLKWPEWVKQQRHSWHGVDYMYHGTNGTFNGNLQKYCETLLGVDESVGTVMEWLKSNGLDESTMVIYMGDNGFSWGEHGLIDKRHFYEESVKVPMLVRCPEIFKGGEPVKKMVQNVDVAPTILECAGLVKPEYMPGHSMIPLLQGDSTQWRERIYYEYFWEYDFPMTPTVFGVRTDQYKYMRYQGIWDQNELYDIINDPEEMHNLMGDPKYADVAKQLASDLYDWLEETHGMNIPLKRTVKNPYGNYKHPKQY